MSSFYRILEFARTATIAIRVETILAYVAITLKQRLSSR